MTQLTTPNSGNGAALDISFSNFQQEISSISDASNPATSSISTYKQSTYHHEKPSGRVSWSHNQSDEITVNSLTDRTAKILKSALDLISDAVDPELNKAEKSNSFDDWKQTIEEITRSAFDFDASHNAIVGIIITSISGKDLWDFSSDALNIFRDATAQLRQNRILKADVDRFTKRLMEANAFKMWHPVYQNDDLNESKLEHQFDEMKSYLLGNSGMNDTQE